jgi:ribose transport system ATP-binding protein
VLGLFGLMGSGRTELARMIFGLDAFERGTILLGSRKGMAFVTENRREEGLLMDACILDNVGLVSMPEYTYWRAPRMVDQPRLRTAVRRVVDSLRIKTGPIERQLAKNLSGGNQQKTVIAKWLMSKSSVFIMDEPTRGIDVGAKVEIYKLINDLAGRGTAVLFISSELEELMACCDRILVMSNGEIQGRFGRAEFDEEQILHAAFRGHKGHAGD